MVNVFRHRETYKSFSGSQALEIRFQSNWWFLDPRDLKFWWLCPGTCVNSHTTTITPASRFRESPSAIDFSVSLEVIVSEGLSP